MNTLLLSQWRLVRVGFVSFLAVALFVPLLAKNLPIVGFPIPGVSLWCVGFAAFLGARLFAREPYSSDLLYWRSLPLKRTRWFTTKLGFGLVVLIVSFASQWIIWQSLSSAFEPTIYRDSVDRYQLRASTNLAWMLGTFASSVYFANSLERTAAARQAWLPGFFSAFALLAFGWNVGPESPRSSASPWPAVILIALSGTGLLCARTLFLRRSVVRTDDDGSVLREGSARATALHAIGQIVFVVLPLTMLIATSTSTLGEYLDQGQWMGWAACWIVIGIVAIPWTWREWRTFRLSWGRALALWTLRTSGFGIPIWKALRGERSTIVCESCGTRRSVRLASCPRCQSMRSVAVMRSRAFSLLIGDTPVQVAALAFVGGLIGQTLWAAFSPFYVTSWRLRCDLPGVRMSSEHDPSPRSQAGGRLLHCLTGPMTRDLNESGSRSVEVTLNIPPPIRGSELHRQFDSSDQLCWAKGRWYQVDLPIPSDENIELHASTTEVVVRSITTQIDYSPRNLRCESTLALSIPSLEARAEELTQAMFEGSSRQDPDIEPAASGDPLIAILIGKMNGAMTERVSTSSLFTGKGAERRHEIAPRCRRLLDSLITRRYCVSDRVDAGLSREFLAEITERAESVSRTEHALIDPPVDLAYYYAPVRALSLTAPSDLLRNEIRSGNAFAAIAAGLRADRSLYDACSEALTFSVRNVNHLGIITPWMGYDRRLGLCAAWAMLAIDRARAADEIFDCIDDRVRFLSALTTLLAYSQSPSVCVRASHLISGQTKRYLLDTEKSQLQRMISGVEAGMRPEEYWFGW